MAQPASRADTSSPPAELTVVHKLEGIGRDWTVLRGCRLRPSDRGSAPTVLIHPAQGIAVLDVAPSATPDAVDAVRSRLAASRFEGIFAGYLPVVHLTAPPRQMASLPLLLDDAFAALPPLELPGGDAWAGVAARALSVEHPAARRVDPPPSQPDRAEDAPRPLHRRRARRRRRGSFLRKAMAVLLAIAALGGIAAVALKEMPSLDPRAPSAAPPSAAMAPSAPSLPPESTAPRGTAALPAPSSPPADAASLAPVPRTPGVDRTAAPIPDAPPPAPPPPTGEAAPAPRAIPAAPPQPAEPQQQSRRPAERAVAPQPQPRRQDAGANPVPAGGGASSPDVGPQRCSRIAARVGSGALVSDADMRYFNEACIRW